MSVLVVCAVDVEADAVRRGLPQSPAVEVVTAGVGPVAAAVATTRALASTDFDCVLSAGIGGGFAGRAGIGDVVVARSVVAADLGCRTTEGFLTVTDLGLDQPSQLDVAFAERWAARIAAEGATVRCGDVLTLSCMTGTDEEASSLATRFPDAAAEAMEGFGVAWAAHTMAVPFGEIRAVSNVIGRRDPAAWDFAAALDALSAALATVLAGPLP
jgi:futalosine hydrolase